MSESLGSDKSSINDVYEFHSSPESNGAVSPVLSTLSGSVLQKTSQITSLSSGVNTQPTLTIATSTVNSYSYVSHKTHDGKIF